MWRDRLNAEVYDRFVREHRVYGRLNRHLAQLAELRGARRVLDLACGTGATALACLRWMDADAELHGLDASPEMIEVARANVLDPRADFRVGPAASVDRFFDGSFDRAVCNAAFWQFPAQRPVLDALHRLMSPGALFVFNIPAERVDEHRPPIHPFQLALARALEERMETPFPASPSKVHGARLVEALRETGFTPEPPSTFEYEGRQAELMDLMAIPAMLAPLAPELSDEDRLAAWRDARSRTDPDEPVRVEWLYFVARSR